MSAGPQPPHSFRGMCKIGVPRTDGISARHEPATAAKYWDTKLVLTTVWFKELTMKYLQFSLGDFHMMINFALALPEPYVCPHALGFDALSKDQQHDVCGRIQLSDKQRESATLCMRILGTSLSYHSACFKIGAIVKDDLQKGRVVEDGMSPSRRPEAHHLVSL